MVLGLGRLGVSSPQVLHNGTRYSIPQVFIHMYLQMSTQAEVSFVFNTVCLFPLVCKYPDDAFSSPFPSEHCYTNYL